MQKGMRLNDGHITYLALLAKKDGTRRGSLSKKSSDNTKWHSKWFALLQNMLFYFENDSNSRPSGLYLLEGCVCDRAPSPKPSLSAKECLEKQVSEEVCCGLLCSFFTGAARFPSSTLLKTTFNVMVLCVYTQKHDTVAVFIPHLSRKQCAGHVHVTFNVT